MASLSEKETFRYEGLDAVRAVAVIAVMTWHLDDSPLRALAGDRGVQWFFVLSGFLITSLAIREEQRSGRVSLRAFLIRRAHRILPLYSLALVAYVLADIVVFRSDRLAEGWGRFWPYYLTFTQDIPELLDWGSGTRPFRVAWSLGVEEKFYLVWPALAFGWCRRYRPVLLAASTTCLALLLIGRPESAATLLLAPYAPVLAGCGLALLLASDWGLRWLTPLLRSTWVGAAGVLLVLWPWGSLDEGGPTVLVYSLAVALALGCIVSGFGRRAESVRIATWIGERSYAIYLFHLLAFRCVRVVTDRLGMDGSAQEFTVLIVGAMLSFAVAGVLRTTIEVPMIQRGRALSAARVHR